MFKSCSRTRASQVIGAVGYGGARLTLPAAVAPHCAALLKASGGMMTRCWAPAPQRPSFLQIIGELTAMEGTVA